MLRVNNYLTPLPLEATQSLSDTQFIGTLLSEVQKCQKQAEENQSSDDELKQWVSDNFLGKQFAVNGQFTGYWGGHQFKELSTFLPSTFAVNGNFYGLWGGHQYAELDTLRQDTNYNLDMIKYVISLLVANNQATVIDGGFFNFALVTGIVDPESFNETKIKKLIDGGGFKNAECGCTV